MLLVVSTLRCDTKFMERASTEGMEFQQQADFSSTSIILAGHGSALGGSLAKTALKAIDPKAIDIEAVEHRS
jgi:hypothetical protein